MNTTPRLNRLLAKGGRCFDVAIDHGFFNERSFLGNIEDIHHVHHVIARGWPRLPLALARPASGWRWDSTHEIWKGLKDLQQ